VTPKGNTDPNKIRINWILIRPLLAVIILSVLGLLRHIMNFRDTNVNPDSLAINIVWVTYNSILLMICIMSAIDVPQRGHVRFPRQEPCRLIINDEMFLGMTMDISEGGALIVVEHFPYRYFSYGRLEFIQPSPIAGLSFTAKPTRIYHNHEGRAKIGLKFTQWDIAAMRWLIPYLYCQPHQWQEVKVPEIQTLWAMLLSVVRFYPLTARGKLF